MDPALAAITQLGTSGPIERAGVGSHLCGEDRGGGMTSEAGPAPRPTNFPHDAAQAMSWLGQLWAFDGSLLQFDHL